MNIFGSSQIMHNVTHDSREKFTILEWPDNSPDLNTIGIAWITFQTNSEISLRVSAVLWFTSMQRSVESKAEVGYTQY